MSFLAPWFAAAALAVSFPLIFHLIRRTPQGRQSFSSLMFLTPSPPRMTRRSRLDHLLLLLLRCLAIILLALAFARPFWREAAQLDPSAVGGRRVAVLVDASASMRRENLWRRAVQEAENVVRQSEPADEVAVFLFADEVRPVAGFEDLAKIAPSRRAEFVSAALAKAQPSWAATDLGTALATAADFLHASREAAGESADAPRQIVVVSDLQSGSDLGALQAYQWPEDVYVEARAVHAARKTNAGLHLAPQALSTRDEEGDQRLSRRLRLINDRLSQRESFQAVWQRSVEKTAENAASGRKPTPLKVYVPVGHSRVAEPSQKEEQLEGGFWRLTGDDHSFDNTLYLAPLRPNRTTIHFVGNDKPDDSQGLRYFLERTFTDTPRRVVEVAAHAPEQPWPELAALEEGLVVIGAPPMKMVEDLKAFVERGGVALYVVSGSADEAPLARLLDQPALQVTEAEVSDYALFGQIDFTHSLFEPLSHPRYSDFTKIRFWKRRRLHLASMDDVDVLAKFDDADAAVVEAVRGKGRLIVLASTWKPTDSQLALSTKFVPLLGGVLDLAGGGEASPPQYLVGEPAPLPRWHSAESVRITTPEGAQVRLEEGRDAFVATDTPGLYRADAAGQTHWFAVNVAPGESRTAPLDIEELSQMGVSIGRHTTQQEKLEELRHLRDVELESRQQLWRWLLLAAICVLGVETWLASWQSRKSRSDEGAAVQHS